MVSPQTKTILEWMAVIVLIGILSFLAFKIFSPTPTPTPTPGGGKNCGPNATHSNEMGGCVDNSCGDYPTFPGCSSMTIPNCGTNGVAKSIPGGNNPPYICVCKNGYFGPNCKKECGSGVPCKNGQSCQNGKCVGGKSCDCKKQGFDTSKTTCSSGSDKCDTCAEGWGPGFPSCNMKKYTNLKLTTKDCHKHGDSKDEWDAICKQDYPGATYVGPICSSSQSGCFFRNIDRKGVCNIPLAYAWEGFDQYANLNPCEPGKINKFKLFAGYVPSS